MSDKEKKGRNPLEGLVKYFKEVRSELKKVAWPTFKQLKNNTIIVILCVLIVGAFIWVLDFGFTKTLGTVVEKYRVDTPAPVDETQIPLDGTQMPLDGTQLPIDIGDVTADEGTADDSAVPDNGVAEDGE